MTRGYHNNWRKTSGVLCDKRIPSQLEECDKRIGGRGSYVTRGRKTSGSYVTRGYRHNWRKTSGVLRDKRIPSHLEEDVGDPM